MGARPSLPLACGQRGQARRRRIGLQELPGQRRRQLGDLESPRIVRLERGRQLVDQARLLPDLPLVIVGQQFELLRGFRARLHSAQVHMIGAQEVGQDPGVKRIALCGTLPEPIASPVQRLRIHRIDPHAMVEQKVHHASLGPLDRHPQLDPLRPPFVQLAPPLGQSLRGVRHCAHGHLRSALVHDPDRVRLIRPVHTQVVAHSSSFRWRPELAAAERERQVRLIPALTGATFS